VEIKCDEEKEAEEEEEEEELRHIFRHFNSITVKWPRRGCMQLF